MATVETVRGPVDVNKLGPTLMHEHMFIMQPEALQNYGHASARATGTSRTRLDDAIAQAGRASARRASARSSIRPRPGLGRYIPRIQRAERCGRSEHRRRDAACTRSSSCRTSSCTAAVDAIAELFVREIREGIDDTGVKAAFLKCAVERHGLSATSRGSSPASPRPAIETGAPVMVHTNAEPNGPGSPRSRR